MSAPSLPGTPGPARHASPRRQFAATVTDLLDEREDLAVVWAEISGQFLEDAARRHPDRAINVGIREQLLVSVGGGLALAGMRPVVHTFGAFLAERAFEQVKLDLAHQDVGAVLVGSGGSFDVAAGGRTHQSPGDVALMDTVPGMHVHAPGTASETHDVLRRAVAGAGLHYVRVVEQVNAVSLPADGRLHVVRRGRGVTVVSFGPVLDAVLDATTDLDATVLHSATVRPFDAATLRAVVDAGGSADVVLVEPWYAGTSAHAVSDALRDVPHRLLSLGVRRQELRRYGTPEEHVAAHGLDARGIRASLGSFLAGDGRVRMTA